MSALNSYELAHRAMRLMNSIDCGPNGRFCDGGRPVYTCPAHGGIPEGHEDWDADDQAAADNFSARSAEVFRV